MNNKHAQFLMYSAGMFLAILSLLAIVGGIVMIRGNRSYNENTISVSGMGEVDSAPDIAHFSFTVQETAKTADEAQEVISEKVSKILAGIKSAGVVESDIKTQSYTINPKYEWLRAKQANDVIDDEGVMYYGEQDRKRVQTGFDVSQNISLKLRDFAKVPEILNLLANTGVQNLYGPNFQIEDPEGLEDEARALAIKDAQEKAKQLAKDLGVKLGKVVTFNENGGVYYPQPYMAKSAGIAMMDMAVEESYNPELPTGENTVTKNISIVYKIK